MQTGRPSKALAEIRASLAIQRKLADDQRAVNSLIFERAISLGSLGMALADTGHPAEAVSEYRPA